MSDNFMSDYLPYFFLGIGLVSIAVSILYDSKNIKFKTFGIPAEGIVYEQDYDTTSFSSSNSLDSYNIKDKITIRFVTRNGEWITGVIKQDFKLYYHGQYKDGQAIKVFYDETNPANFYVDTGQSELLARVFTAIVGLIFSVYGLYQFSTN